MESFWHVDAPRVKTALPSGPSHVDVAIVGAGFTGLSAAHLLASHQVKVAVFEKTQVAYGASGRNAGFLAPGAAEAYSTVQQQFGAETMRDLYRMSQETIAMVRRLQDETTLDLQIRLDGILNLARTEVELQELQQSQETMALDGHPAEMVQVKDLPRPLQSMYIGGYFLQGGGSVQPARLAMALAERALSAGAEIYAPCPVHAITRTSKGFALQTPSGRMTADRVLLATNGFTEDLWPDGKAPIAPTRGQVLATEPLPTLLPIPVGAHSGYEYYRQNVDGRLIIGGWRDVSFDAEDTSELALNDHIQAALAAFATELAGYEVQIDVRWSGIMGFTSDHLPIVGELEPGLYISAGYSGHGVVFAPLCGELIAKTMLGTPVPDLAHFSPDRPTLIY